MLFFFLMKVLYKLTILYYILYYWLVDVTCHLIKRKKNLLNLKLLAKCNDLLHSSNNPTGPVWLCLRLFAIKMNSTAQKLSDLWTPTVGEMVCVTLFSECSFLLLVWLFLIKLGERETGRFKNSKGIELLKPQQLWRLKSMQCTRWASRLSLCGLYSAALHCSSFEIN